MTIKELMACFEEAYSTWQNKDKSTGAEGGVGTPERHMDARKGYYSSVSQKRRINAEHQTYPIQKLPDLIKLLCENKRLEFPDEYAVRYLVTLDGEILFAREGFPNIHVPAHNEMNGLCLAAGNVFFSEDFKSITKINNKSGGFKPHFQSLVWPLAILLFWMETPPAEVHTASAAASGAGGDAQETALLSLADNLILTLISKGESSDLYQTEDLEIKREELRDLLPKALLAKKADLLSQNQRTETLVHRVQRQGCGGAKKSRRTLTFLGKAEKSSSPAPTQEPPPVPRGLGAAR